jgi:hypothetical protein
LHLMDAPFSRTDLFERVLRRMPAERIHVLIDSCHSYFLVNARGERVRVSPDSEDLERYPHVGFLLSTSSREEVQEWSGYQGGVFSHQVLGALRGAADLDGDGQVGYSEIHAYVLAANRDVRDPEARIHPFVRPPSVRGEVLLDLGQVPGQHRLALAPSFSGRFHLRGLRSGRLLDAHKGADHPLNLVVPSGEPIELVLGDQVISVVTSSGTLALSSSRSQPATGKGAVSDELRERLFYRPLTRQFVEGVRVSTTPRVTLDRTSSEAVAVSWYRDPLTVTLFSGAAIGIAAGIVGAVYFADARATANHRPVDEAAVAALGPAQDWQAVTIAGFSGGAALLAAGLVSALVGASW